MQNKLQLQSLLSDYLVSYPDQVQRASALLEFVNTFDGDDLYLRTNFTGHITASAYILNSSRTAMLLLKHKFLDRWLQPGGHVELSDESILAGAQREASEETGIPGTELMLESENIFDIDSHPIPENKKKGEPAHIHHDIAFLYTYRGPAAVNIDIEESTAAKWISLPDLEIDPMFGKVARKIKSMG
ncbi:NUDIX domain-containing protein [Segetibacter sp. 3557_3]|uniref:NUDIX hydrolase n=1 Tax=Segetibacter sp. 3557_3 TaxID=2547429 RepID=UPI001058F0BE|nr:NUDIX hydrolase [Segetibacter sp. 3557_3]TDH19733.1 NUDIX domain-containing protein [Segetibacter sp. 3557_3]